MANPVREPAHHQAHRWTRAEYERLVEVADSSLDYDRSRKAPVYARNHVPEYWIVNLRDRVLEIHRQPAGEGYRLTETRQVGERVSPLAAPRCTVAVRDLLP